MVWTISFTESARKQLRKLDKQVAERLLDFIVDRIASQADPRSAGRALTGPTLGTYWRYRVGDYRIICELRDSELCVLVIKVENRKDVYR